MLDTYEFGNILQEHGFRFYSGVPCSFLKSLINYAINEVEYTAAANEGDAVATCVGAYLGGQKPVVLMQNSGLTNATSPLTSLNYVFRLPVLGFVSLRGEPGLEDEPQHELMGVITTDMLTMMKVQWEFLDSDLGRAIEQVKRATAAIENQQTFFFVVKKGTFNDVALKPQSHRITASQSIVPKRPGQQQILRHRHEVLSSLLKIRGEQSVFVATTGFTGRELYQLEDSKQHFYMVGSMGCVNSIGLGLALVQPKREIFVLDGDGALLMRMGALATNGSYAPANMFHLLLDNNAHESTGGQLTVSNNVDFVALANACGYPCAKYAHSIEELLEFITQWREQPKLTFVYLGIQSGTLSNLGRPKVSPQEVAERMRAHIAKHITKKQV